MENEKFINIRKAIQQTILPLVQAIYIEEPSDINQFCFQYFENRRKDGNENDNIGDGSIAKAGGFSTKDEEDHCIDETNNDCDTNIASRSSIQGSASMPILNSDKLPDCLPVRETSSWNEPRKVSQRNGSRSTLDCSLADVLSKIGDQASLVENAEKPEIETKRGDVSSTIRNDGDTEFKNQTPIEENRVLQTGQELEEYSRTCAFPSAPPYENDNKNFINVVSSTLKNSQVLSKPLVEYSDERSFSSGDELEMEKVNEPLKEFSRESRRISNAEPGKEEVKKCGGKLSPNSSFGFIPHLQEYRSQNEIATQSKCPEDNRFKSRSAYEAGKLTNDISEAFQGLAKEFRFAESNLNSEFLKAKEISDIIQGPKRLENPGISNEENIVNNAIKSTEGPKTNKNDSLDGVDTYTCHRNEVIQDVNDSKLDQLHLEATEMSDILVETNNSCKIECISYSNNQTEDIKNESHANLPKFTTGYKVLNIKPEDDKEENYQTKENTIFSRNTEEEENRYKYNGTQSYVDESWRKRWYEVHPRLDNIQSSFRQRIPIHPAHHIDESNRISRSIQGIGEAGDVPRDPRLRAARGVGRLESYSESKLETNSSPSTFEECSNLYSSLSADEIYRKMSSGRVACNFYNRSSIHSKSGVSSRNIPYSWRDMTTKQPASIVESEDQNAKDSHLKPTYEVNSEIPSEVDYKVDLPGHESTDEEFVEIEDQECKYFEPVGNKCIARCEGNESDNEYEECVPPENFQENVTGSYTALQNNAFIAKDWDAQNGSAIDVEYIEVDTDAAVAYESLMSESQLEYFNNKPEHIENIQSQIYPHVVPHNQSEDHETIKKSVKYDSENERNGTNMADDKTSSEKKADKNSVLNLGSTVKVEPGLNSACGDFVATNNTENNQHEFNLNPSSFSPGYLTNLTQVGQSPTEAHPVGITREGFEEVMRNVLLQQEAYSDDGRMVLLEGFQGSDTSNVGSSDISEEEDSYYYPENEPHP